MDETEVPDALFEDVASDQPPEVEMPAERRDKRGGQRLPFIEAIANERSYAPLAFPDNGSSVIRRRLLRGEAITAEAGVELGSTDGLVGACTRLMTEWGFVVDVWKSEEDGKTYYKLKNPEHVPTEKIKREPTGSRTQKAEAEKKVLEQLMAGEPISIAESVEMGVNKTFLRREVDRLQREKYGFQIAGLGDKRTFQLVHIPKKRGRPKGVGNKQNGLATTPVAAVTPANGHKVPDAVSELLFGGELATPPPKLGGYVRVVGLMLDENDEVKVALRGDEGTWATAIEGFGAR